MKASFFRNILNYEMLLGNSGHYSGVIAEYCSIATIYLSEEAFKDFCSNFQKSYDFLIPFVDKASIAHGVWNCISIVCGHAGVLVVMDHYQYPRYLAAISK